MSYQSRLAHRMRRVATSQFRSSLTVSAFCRKHRIPVSTFWNWRKRLKAENFIIPPQEPAAAPQFVRLVPESQPALCREGCSLDFPDGRVLRFPADYPVSNLLLILKSGTL